jgi:hypothetical protein
MLIELLVCVAAYKLLFHYFNSECNITWTDDDSTSQSSPKEEDEKPQQPTKKSPKKGAIPGRKATSMKQPSTSAAFEDYSSIASGKSEAQRTTRTKKSPASKRGSKQNEDKTLAAPSTSGEGRHRILKKNRQKTSPQKVTRKERYSEECEEGAASTAFVGGEDHDSRSSTPEVIMPQRGRPPRKKRTNSNASRVRQTRTRGSPARKLQYENSKPAAADSSAKAKKSPSSATNVGTTRKKRRVEAIVETLQKSTGSPSGSSSMKEDEVEDTESDGGNAQGGGAAGIVSIGDGGGNNDGVVSGYGGGNNVGDEDNCNSSSRGFDTVPTLARITPLITRSVPKKGAQRIGDSGQNKYVQNLQHLPARSLKSPTEGGDAECS